MAKGKMQKVDPVLRKNFNAFCQKHLQFGPAAWLPTPIKSLPEICKYLGVTYPELQRWRSLAFPIYRVKGMRKGEKWYANPEMMNLWFRWREQVQSGLAPVNLTALDS